MTNATLLERPEIKGLADAYEVEVLALFLALLFVEHVRQ